MTKDQKNQLDLHIRLCIDSINGNIAAYKAGSQPVSPDNAIGRITRMEAINSKSINEAALRKARTTRTMLEKALWKIDSDDFGLCRNCEEPIAFARLMAVPETDLCVACANRHE